MDARPVTVLAGGVGAARFLQGVVDVVAPERVVAIGNVGDDVERHGLHVSPDLDTVLYTLTGWIDEEKGWGIRGDTARALERARSLGADAWFWLGDVDIGLHLARTEALARGEPLSAVTARLCERLGLRLRLVPVTDDRLRTMVDTAEAGEVDFQTYYVRRGHSDRVRGLRFEGAEAARAAPGVLDAVAVAAEIEVGADLAELLAASVTPVAGDVVVVSHKAVSKAEGRLADLRDVEPSARARELAGEGGDPRLAELVLRESRRIVRRRGSPLIAETRHGFVCAQAGIDRSNTPSPDVVVLLPLDPDASARRLRAGLER